MAASRSHAVTEDCGGPPRSGFIAAQEKSSVMNTSSNKPFGNPTKPGTALDYLSIARLDHSTKHIFIFAGIILAYVLRGVRVESLGISIGFGLGAAVFVASANYVINEWLDRDSDSFHPTKSGRSAVQKILRKELVLLEWAGFLGLGLICALISSLPMFVVACVFGLQGMVYNVPPFRTKEVPYLDVISESINNPIRFTMGWLMVDSTSLPPSSIVLLFWFGGAFLMAAKRLSEFKEIVDSHGKQLLSRYRISFSRYTETSLTVSCFVYALCSSFMLAVFLIKYRAEYLLVFPVVVALFSYYLALSMEPKSAAQNPEKLYRDRGLIFLVMLLIIMFLLTTFVDFPVIEFFARQRYIAF